jgi:hypothetical protein
MYSKTIEYLEKFDNQHDFERMCADILKGLGYKDVVLIAPRGGSDGGRDITFTTEVGGKGLACATIGYKENIEVKFNHDFAQRTPGEYDKYYFFCTAYLTSKQKLNFFNFCANTLQAESVPKDIEALRSLLDSALTRVRESFLYLSEQDRQKRSILLGKLRRLYVLSGDGMSPGMIAGTEPLPKDWVERQLVALGETWRQDVYF